jgi:hypothetical protein
MAELKDYVWPLIGTGLLFILLALFMISLLPGYRDLRISAYFIGGLLLLGCLASAIPAGLGR